jgi:hypothetical protein
MAKRKKITICRKKNTVIPIQPQLIVNKKVGHNHYFIKVLNLKNLSKSKKLMFADILRGILCRDIGIGPKVNRGVTDFKVNKTSQITIYTDSYFKVLKIERKLNKTASLFPEIKVFSSITPQKNDLIAS